MDEPILETFERSIERCTSRSRFLDLFYEKFLASSPRVREKFKDTDFVRQKRALKASLHLILLAARDDEGDPGTHLGDVAGKHSARNLDIGAELYDLWLDSLLEAVEECDPDFDSEVGRAWEDVMMVGIRYLIVRYHR